LIYGVAVVECFGEGVDAAKREIVAQATVDVHLKRVIGAVADGKPCPSVGDGGVRFRSACGNEKRASGDWSTGERCGKIRRIFRRTRSRGTDDWKRSIGVDADELVIAVRADVANSKGSVGGEFALDPE